MTPSPNPSSEELDSILATYRNYVIGFQRGVLEHYELEEKQAEAKRRLQSLINAARKEAQADILRTAIDNIHDEIDAGVPEDLASRTVLLQMEYDLKPLTAEQPTKLEGE